MPINRQDTAITNEHYRLQILVKPNMDCFYSCLAYYLAALIGREWSTEKLRILDNGKCYFSINGIDTGCLWITCNMYQPVLVFNSLKSVLGDLELDWELG